MSERTFSHHHLTITVCRERIRERLARGKVLARLGAVGGDELQTGRQLFARLVAVSSVSGMPFPTADASAEELQAAFHAWLELDGDLLDTWLLEMELANAPVNEPELLPPASDEEKKSRKRGAR